MNSDTLQHNSLNRETRPEPEQDAPLKPLTSGGFPFVHGLVPHLIKYKQHAGTPHVAIFAQHMLAGS